MTGRVWFVRSGAAGEHGRILLAKQGCWVHMEREWDSVLTPHATQKACTQ